MHICTRSHRPHSEIKYQQKNHWGEVLNFSFLKIIRRLLLFARLSYYFTPYNRLTDYSLQVHKLTKSSTLLSFWPAGFILPPIIENLLIYFFPIWTLCLSISETMPSFYLYAVMEEREIFRNSYREKSNDTNTETMYDIVSSIVQFQVQVIYAQMKS